MMADRRQVSVEYLLYWALGQQGVDLLLADMANEGPASSAAPAAWISLAPGGGQHSGSFALGRLTDDLPPDAIHVYRAARVAVTWAQWTFILPYARKYDAPDWGRDLWRQIRQKGCRRLVPALIEDKGTRELRPRVCQRVDGRRIVRYCPLEVEDISAEFELNKAQYSQWFGVMELIAGSLINYDRFLTRFTCSGVNHAKAPWSE